MPEASADHGAAFDRLVAVMDRLRSPGGCPWDAAQTHESLMPYLIEESYELVEAIEAGDNDVHVREELGDVLLQVIFHARIADERTADDGGFGIDDVVTDLTAKLRRRHPHVFETDESSAAKGQPAGTDPTIADLHASWDALKRAEKPERLSVFDGIPPALPALAHAAKTISKARRAGLTMDDAVARPMDDPLGVHAPVDEATLGTALFALVENAVEAGVDPEGALRRATRAYRGRLGNTGTTELG